MEQLPQIKAIWNVFGAGGLLHPPKRVWRSKGDRHALDVEDEGVFDRVRIGHAAPAFHEINENLIANTNHAVFSDFTWFKLKGGLVGKNEQGFDDAGFVFQ